MDGFYIRDSYAVPGISVEVLYGYDTNGTKDGEDGDRDDELGESKAENPVNPPCQGEIILSSLDKGS